jgi:hypothetical protein
MMRTVSDVLSCLADGGTRYIMDDLIHKVSGQEKFEQITVLNLTLVKDGGKIKVT